MSIALVTVRTARTPHRCDNAYPAVDAYLYGHPHIRPGDRYVRCSIPPNSELGNEGWWTYVLCWPCGEGDLHSAGKWVP